MLFVGLCNTARILFFFFFSFQDFYGHFLTTCEKRILERDWCLDVFYSITVTIENMLNAFRFCYISIGHK